MSDLDVRLARLADRARASRKQAADDRRARDDVIEEADRAGYSLSRIGRITGQAPANVQRIVAIRTAARQARARRAAGV